MNILADENFPGDAVRALRREEHDVVWIAEISPGISDDEVLALAQAEDRVVVTFDKDFGELSFRVHLSALSGVILFRISMESPAQVAALAVTAIESRSDWAGHFSVVEDDRIRMTPLPDS